MTMPTRTEIENHARELWIRDQYRSGDPQLAETNPEYSELLEGGYIACAQSELMANESRKYAEYEAYDRYVEKNENEDVEVSKGLPLDFAEAKRSNLLISGGNQTGKTLTAIQICDLLQQHGWQIIVFDNSAVWRRKSNIQNCYVVYERKGKISMHEGESLLIDMSLLTPKFQQRFVEQLTNQIWNIRLQQSCKWLLLVFEEFQLYGKNLRGDVSQNILRLMSAGANLGIRVLAVSPDLALIDPSFIRLCGQRYHFRLGCEINAKRRFRGYYGEKWLDAVQRLEVGQCLYWKNGKMESWKIPKFELKVPMSVKT